MAIDAAEHQAADPDTGAPAATTSPAPPPLSARHGRWAAVLVPLLLVLVAGALRFWDLDHPGRIYFDETYYANDAENLLRRGVEEDFAVHPPLGKWLIASGIAVVGFDTLGWRVASATAGTLTVLVTYLLGLRLFRRRGVAALAAFLLAIDGLAFTMSRIAMLDAFLALFVALGVWFLVLDRDRLWTALPTDVEPDDRSRRALPLRGRAFRWLAGLSFGLALATKWSALLAIGLAALYLAASELLWRRRVSGSLWTRLWPAVGAGVVALLVLPAVVYVASYAGWFANFANTRPGAELCGEAGCEVTVPEIVRAWWGEQREIAEFHADLEAEHRYRAGAWTWPLLARPVAYYYESCTAEEQAEDECVVGPGNVGEILGLGNPAIWWTGLLLCYPLVLWGMVRRDWPAWTIGAFLFGQMLPWLAAPRTVFLFYMTPVVPFLCLGLAYGAARVAAVRALRWVPLAVVVLAIAAFLFWHPLYVGTEISREAWWLRIWIRPGWI